MSDHDHPLLIMAGLVEPEESLPIEQRSKTELIDLIKKLVETGAQQARAIQPMIEQFCRDLNGAHDEILRLQDVKPEDFGKYDWPEWTPQANSIRWAEKRLGKRLAKTTAWTLFP